MGWGSRIASIRAFDGYDSCLNIGSDASQWVSGIFSLDLTYLNNYCIVAINILEFNVPRLNRSNQKIQIEISRKRLGIKKLLDGKEIREAAKALEDARLGLLEEEFMFDAKLIIKYDANKFYYLVAYRLETNEEFDVRQAQIEEHKKEARRKAERRAERALARQKALFASKQNAALEKILSIMRDNDIDESEIIRKLESYE